MTIFPLFVQTLFQWGIGTTLDVLVKCFKCNQQDKTQIKNVAYNHIVCSNCHRVNKQFTNACDTSVDKHSMQIGQVALGSSQDKWKYDSPWFSNEEPSLYIPHDIRLIGLDKRTLVLKSELKSFETGKLIHSKSTVLVPSNDDTKFRNRNHIYNKSTLYHQAREDVLLVESKILTEYRDVLIESKRVVENKYSRSI